MTRDRLLPENQPEPEPSDPDPERRLAPMTPGPLVVTGVIGLVGGWALHPLADAWLTATPRVGWGQIGVLWFLAAALVMTARSTRRDLRATPRRLRPHQAVNRLVMARACAVVGALLAGGYAGFAIGWINTGAPDLVVERMLTAGLAAAAGTVILVASLALERACRAGSVDEDV